MINHTFCSSSAFITGTGSLGMTYTTSRPAQAAQPPLPRRTRSKRTKSCRGCDFRNIWSMSSVPTENQCLAWGVPWDTKEPGCAPNGSTKFSTGIVWSGEPFSTIVSFYFLYDMKMWRMISCGRPSMFFSCRSPQRCTAEPLTREVAAAGLMIIQSMGWNGIHRYSYLNTLILSEYMLF